MRDRVVRSALAWVVLLSYCLPAHTQDVLRLEQQLVQEVNRSRSERGLAPLKTNNRLTQAAREHSQRMAKQGTLSHVLPGEKKVAERIASTGLRFNRSGENVGYNSDSSGLHSGFMNSPPHRANILSPDYTDIGIGVVRDANGIYWATQNFARVLPDRTASQAAGLAAQSFQSMRRKQKLPPLQLVQKQQLQKLACNMAKAEKLNPRSVLSAPGVRNVMTYNNSRPEELPANVKTVVNDRSLKQFAVAACETSNPSNPGGTYYVVMAFY